VTISIDWFAFVQVFLAEKNFEGCGGVELDNEMRVTIAGSGCLMLLGRDHDLFKEVESILVYPSTVVATDLGRSTFDTSGRVVEEGKAVLGLAVHGGAVIPAGDTAPQAARDALDGRNVIIHELAHKIDFIDGSADGTPEFETFAQRQEWAAAMAPAFLSQKQRAEKGKKSLLDDYAITNEAEYFAVASEVFFEKPKALAKQLPAVYKSLAEFYKLDLAARVHDEAPVKGKKPAAKDKKPAAKGDAPSRKSSPAIAPGAAPAFRKTAAMAVVSLPADLEAELSPKSKKASTPETKAASKAAPDSKAATKAAPANDARHAPSRKSSPVIDAKQAGSKSAPASDAAAKSAPETKQAPSRKSAPVIDAKQAPSKNASASGAKAANKVAPASEAKQAPRRKSAPAITVPPKGKSSAAIVVPPVETKAARGKSSAAIVSPPGGTKPARGKSSAAMVIPHEAIEKATRGRSSAAIVVPPVENKPSRGKSSAAIVVPPIEGKPSRGKSSAAIVIPHEAIEKATRGKSSAAIVVPPVDEKPAPRKSR